MSQLNPDTTHIDEVSTLEMIAMFNQEDKKVALAVEKCLADIAMAVDMITASLRGGGRLFYIGSGTSGKLGILDASECPPTFGVDNNTVIGIISGGLDAISGWCEETEDDELLAEKDLQKHCFSAKDVLVAITASGNTPYAMQAVRYAGSIGAKTIGLCCAPNSTLEAIASICIIIDVGPEAIMGSTRLKCGTAQKMVLNMLSSGAMIKLGKTYHNLMVDVRPINRKLQQRVVDIVKIATGKEEGDIRQALKECDGKTKIAILMLLLNTDVTTAQVVLEKHDGYLKKALKDCNQF